MTKTHRFNRRKAAAFGIALASAAGLAITAPASAALGPNVGAAGDVRVVPTDGAVDGLIQPAPGMVLGRDNQKAANSQIRMHNVWKQGDRILYQLRDSDGENCDNKAQSIGYSSVPTVTSSANALIFNANSPFADNSLGASPDVPLLAPNPNLRVAPTFTVNLLSSSECDGAGVPANAVNDIVEIRFTNASLPLSPGMPNNVEATDVWVLNVSNSVYNVGSDVQAGPVHNVPFAQDATNVPGGFVNTPLWFGGNQAAIGNAPAVQNLWTNTAFVIPFTLSASNSNANVADGSNQNLGSITLTETRADGFATALGTYEICYSAQVGAVLDGPGLLTTTRETSLNGFGPQPAGLSTSTGNCVEVVVTDTAGFDEIVVSNIFGSVDFAGALSVNVKTIPGNPTYLEADDRIGALGEVPLSNSVASHVEILSPYLTVPVSTVAAQGNRIGGADRFETAAKIAANLPGTCNDVAVLVNGKAFPDALSATYLAGAIDAVYGNQDSGEVPILLTNADSIPQATVIAMRELGVRSVYIVGGNTAVNAQVEAQLKNTRRYYCGGETFFNDQNIVVDRLGGADRYATNRSVVEAAQSILANNFNARLRYQSFPAQPQKRTALVATGQSFADALIAGPIAYGGDSPFGFPLILTKGDALSPEALQTMVAVDIEQAVILGGPSAVSMEVQAAIEATGVQVIRIAGADRYETGTAVNNWVLGAGFPGSVSPDRDYAIGLNRSVNGRDAYLARGDVFADALASAPLVAETSGVLVLTKQNSLPASSFGFLTGHPEINQVIGLGLGAAISNPTLAAANAAVNP